MGLTPFQRKIRAYEMSPEWHARAARFRRKFRRCQACKRVRRLDVHHVTYRRAFAGKEWDRDLRALCRECHNRVHVLARRMPLRTATTRVIRRGRVLGLLRRAA